MNLVTLKILGFVFMIIDHIGIVIDFFPFRLVGRLAFPIFAFLVANGYIHTCNKKKYFLRFLFLALLSEIPYDLFNYSKLSFEGQNIFFTLLLGFIFIWIIDKNRGSYKTLLLGLLMFLLVLLNLDYGVAGITIIICFFCLRKSLKMQYILIFLLLLTTFDGLGIIGGLSLLLINAYNPDKPFNKKFNKWLYVVYPVQYLILFIVRCFI